MPVQGWEQTSGPWTRPAIVKSNLKLILVFVKHTHVLKKKWLPVMQLKRSRQGAILYCKDIMN